MRKEGRTLRSASSRVACKDENAARAGPRRAAGLARARSAPAPWLCACSDPPPQKKAPPNHHLQPHHSGHSGAPSPFTAHPSREMLPQGRIKMRAPPPRHLRREGGGQILPPSAPRTPGSAKGTLQWGAMGGGTSFLVCRSTGGGASARPLQLATVRAPPIAPNGRLPPRLRGAAEETAGWVEGCWGGRCGLEGGDREGLRQ